MKILCENEEYKCFINDENKLFFEIKIADVNLSYNLSGHPYEPVIYLKCNNPSYSFNIRGGLWFPDNKEYAWELFCHELSHHIKKNYYLKIKNI